MIDTFAKAFIIHFGGLFILTILVSYVAMERIRKEPEKRRKMERERRRDE